jgi:hypothetical protein
MFNSLINFLPASIGGAKRAREKETEVPFGSTETEIPSISLSWTTIEETVEEAFEEAVTSPVRQHVAKKSDVKRTPARMIHARPNEGPANSYVNPGIARDDSIIADDHSDIPGDDAGIDDIGTDDPGMDIDATASKKGVRTPAAIIMEREAKFKDYDYGDMPLRCFDSREACLFGISVWAMDTSLDGGAFSVTTKGDSHTKAGKRKGARRIIRCSCAGDHHKIYTDSFIYIDKIDRSAITIRYGTSSVKSSVSATSAAVSSINRSSGSYESSIYR